MGRLSTRTEYQDPDIYQSVLFKSKLSDRNYQIFMDWIGGMTGPELSKKWHLADITIRNHLTTMKRIYDEIKTEERS